MTLRLNVINVKTHSCLRLTPVLEPEIWGVLTYPVQRHPYFLTWQKIPFSSFVKTHHCSEFIMPWPSLLNSWRFLCGTARRQLPCSLLLCRWRSKNFHKFPSNSTWCAISLGFLSLSISHFFSQCYQSDFVKSYVEVSPVLWMPVFFRPNQDWPNGCLFVFISKRYPATIQKRNRSVAPHVSQQ